LWEGPRVRKDVFDRVPSQSSTLPQILARQKLESDWANTSVTK